MKVDVFAVTFHGRFVERDEAGNETNSRIGAAEKTVLVAAPNQAAAIALVVVAPDGQEAVVNHVATVARNVEVNPRALRRAEVGAAKAAEAEAAAGPPNS